MDYEQLFLSSLYLWCVMLLADLIVSDLRELLLATVTKLRTQTFTNVCVRSMTSVMKLFIQLLCTISQSLNHYPLLYENSCCH